jgi:hypothetical protein
VLRRGFIGWRPTLGILILMPLLAMPFFGHEPVFEQPAVQPAVPGDRREGEGQPPQEEKSAQATENDALRLSAADLITLPPDDAYYTRYLWIPSASVNHARAASYTLNLISRAPIIYRPVPLGKGPLMVLRVDLQQLAATEQHLAELVQTWEEFQYDPRFSLLLTKGTIEFAVGIKIPKKKVTRSRFEDVKVPVPEGWKHTDGKTYYSRWEKKEVKETVEVEALDDTDVIRQVSPHLDFRLVEQLVDGSQSQAPVVSLPYFVGRALRQVQDKGAYRTIYGGLYYRFRGIRKGFKKGTDEDNYFSDLGVGNVGRGVRARDVFNQQQSDARIAVAQSAITGRPRRVDFLRTLSGHVNFNTGFLSITQDLKRDSIDIDTHPLMNLDPFSVVRFDAKESIRELTNGLNEFALWNGNGDLLDQATDDVAVDTTIPSPYGTVLEPAIGCVRCHANEAGWRIVHNDVTDLRKTLDVFDDIGARKKTVKYHGREYNQQEAITRIVGLYAGDPEVTALPRAREDYARAILKATGPWPGSKDQTDIVRLASGEVSSIFASEFYRTLTAVDALHDLGVVWQGKDPKAAGKKLGEVLALDPAAVQAGTIYIYPLRPGDPTLRIEDARGGLLLSGKALVRSDYDLWYSFMATRYTRLKR